MKILITGAFGNVGLYTLKNLLSKGHKVRVLELKNKNNLKIFDDLQKKNGYSIDMVWGDITDVLSVSKAVKGQDIIIHQAFIIPALSEQKPNWAWEINVEGTRNLLRAAAEEEVKAKIVFTSSVSVFGETQDQKSPRKIEDQVKPTDNYSHHKVACEQLVKISGLKWTILRLGAVLSPSLCEIDPMLFSVSLDNRIELVHAADAGSALANAAVSDQVWGKTLLIGGGKRCQMLQKDFITRVLDEVGLGMFPENAFTSKPFYTDWMDTSESQHLLKYQEKDLDDFLIEIRKVLGIRRYLLRAVKPIVKYWILKKSPYLPGKRSTTAKTKPGIKNSPVSAIQ
ncbi:MAG: NAD(P)-dependent oxidoreductase [Actinobacteria bacterium]|nr:NAD(P)-dependent oxidoreductase [Actinomycetota bacterium]